MMAATAVGVSHLVYSTQSGADYGFSLVWVIVLIVMLKYPAFRFAVDYASATERSLVTAYSKISKIALAWLAAGFFVDMFIATGAISLVTAGLIISVFKIPLSGPQVAVGLMILSAVVLLNGHYEDTCHYIFRPGARRNIVLAAAARQRRSGSDGHIDARSVARDICYCDGRLDADADQRCNPLLQMGVRTAKG
jgi:hypothetical protein